MITLATLADATEQEVFDQVLTNLRKQGKPSRDTAIGACLYRHNDLKCAAGWLISDKEYQRSMDYPDGGSGDSSWSDLVQQNLAPTAHMNLIHKMQECHDRAGRRWLDDEVSNQQWLAEFNIMMEALAKRSNLVYN